MTTTMTITIDVDNEVDAVHPSIISLDHHKNSMYFYYPHFTDEDPDR